MLNIKALKTVIIGVSDFSDFFETFEKSEVKHVCSFIADSLPEEIADSINFECNNYFKKNILSDDEIMNIVSEINHDRFYCLDDSSHPKNAAFIYKYNMTNSRIKNLIKNISENDYCYSIKYNDSRTEENFHVFAIDKELENLDTYEIVPIYIKLKFIDDEKGNKQMVITSLHRRKFDLKHPFR